MTPRRIAIVPHSHWDREWYESYQEFRLNLVDMLDTLLPLLESDASYPYFMLDGQMAVVDDYLEVRPEAEPRLRALAAAGRISMGPWYILMDEFLSSGETIIRNLEMGIVRGAAFGGVMDVGYLPDMFGHIAQMPQILRQAGFAHAVVWRGVPSAVTKDAFVWEAPDGSTVRAEYLPVGYGNGAALPDDAKALVRRTADLVKEIEPFLIDDLLCMNGSDHLFPQPWLGRVVAEANDLQDELVFEVTSLPRYLADAPTEGLEHWKGELRSGFRSNMLMGVTSNRVDVKRMGARAERALERRAEPLAALFQTPAQWPAQLLALAWKEMVRNSAHDSICACSVDDVVDAVLHRYAEARTIADRPGRPGRGVVRPLPGRAGHLRAQPRPAGAGGVVELVVGAEEPPSGDVQVVSERTGLPGSMVLDATTVRTVLGMLQGPKIDNDAWVHDIGIEEDDEGLHITVTVGAEERPNVPIAEAKQDVYARLGAKPDTIVHISLNQPPIRRIVARVASRPRLRLAAVRAGAVGPSGRGAPAGRHRRPLQRPPHGRGGCRPRHLLPQRAAGLRPAGGRGRPRGLLQLLAAAARRAGRHTGLRLGAGGRARPGAGPRHHHRRLRVARPCRRVVTGAGRRAPGGGRDGPRAESRRARRAGGHVLREPESRPPAAGPPPAARAGAHVARRRAHSPSSSGGSRPRAGRMSSACRRPRRTGSSPPEG
jgi:mannosylglycerate hydrolase